jgi:hypothetical protein
MHRLLSIGMAQHDAERLDIGRRPLRSPDPDKDCFKY